MSVGNRKKSKPLLSSSQNNGISHLKGDSSSTNLILSQKLIEPITSKSGVSPIAHVDKGSLAAAGREVLSTNDQNRTFSNASVNSCINQKDNLGGTEDENSTLPPFNEGVVHCVCSSQEDDGIMLQVIVVVVGFADLFDVVRTLLPLAAWPLCRL